MYRYFLVALLLAAVSCFSGCASYNAGSISTEMSGSDNPFSAYENSIDVRLDGATNPVMTEIFGKIVGSAEGVVSAKRYSSRIVPDNPQASSVLWRATVSGIDGFGLQTTIMDMARDVFLADGYLTLQGVPYRYSRSEIDMLKGLRPADATSRALWFVIDRELARDREMSGW